MADFLPNGDVAKNEVEHIETWRALGRKVGALLGATPVAYEPGINFVLDADPTVYFRMGTTEALAVAALADKAKAYHTALVKLEAGLDAMEGTTALNLWKIANNALGETS